MKFTEAVLEKAIIELLKEQGYPYVAGNKIARAPMDVNIKHYLREFLAKRYADDKITNGEI